MIGMFAAMFSGEKRGNPDLISIFGSNFVRASIFPVRYPCPVRSPMRYPRQYVLSRGNNISLIGLRRSGLSGDGLRPLECICSKRANCCFIVANFDLAGWAGLTTYCNIGNRARRAARRLLSPLSTPKEGV